MAHIHSRTADRRRLLAVFGLSSSVLLVQVLAGIASNSLALLADAGHVLTDVAGMGLSLLAMWVATRPASSERTYGFLRLEVLAAGANATLLAGIAVLILVESVRRFIAPPPLESGIMLLGAAYGLAVNVTSFLLLRDGKDRSLNLRGAYLEVLGDAAGSAAVIVAAVVVALTGVRAADPVASGLIALLILPRTWRLLRETLDVLLEAAPRDVDLGHVRAHILEAPGVIDVHDLHAWTITSGMNVVSAHVVLGHGADATRALEELCRCLSDDFDIEHSTFQLETQDRRRREEAVHP